MNSEVSYKLGCKVFLSSIINWLNNNNKKRKTHTDRWFLCEYIIFIIFWSVKEIFETVTLSNDTGILQSYIKLAKSHRNKASRTVHLPGSHWTYRSLWFCFHLFFWYFLQQTHDALNSELFNTMILFYFNLHVLSKCMSDFSRVNAHSKQNF